MTTTGAGTSNAVVGGNAAVATLPINNAAAKYITKQVTKFIPLGGQASAAGLDGQDRTGVDVAAVQHHAP